ncbi:MAG: CDP-alcohol phosphatidyltransferase family protein [Peptostreptococcaceae bacterium]|nr:CDP-alcohol phosphatidyltransferase family protein [Peptostreptococcaceae bacterium]
MRPKKIKKEMLKILVHSLTLSRFVLTFYFAQAIFMQRNIYESGMIFTLIGMTDLLDGKAARHWEVQSHLGAALDVTADFTFIVISCFVMFLKDLFPLWMISVIVLKFFEFIVTSHLLRKKGRSERLFVFDLIGRSISVLFYVLPMVNIILYRMLSPESFVFLQTLMLPIIGGCAVLSSCYRIHLCIKSFAKQMA